MASRRQPVPRVALLLGGGLLLAIFMGAGPGVHLVNPEPDSPQPATILGIPVLYAWYLFWLGIEGGIVIAAYFLLWRREDDPA